MNDKIRDRDRNRPPRDDPYDNLKNIHLDVHGLRRDIRDAIERSQTALMNRLSVLEAKIDKLTAPSGGEVVTDADKALMATSAAQLKTVVAKAKALDEMTS